MAEILQTLRVSLRTLRRSPALVLCSILALGLGIGLTTAMYSISRGALRDLPVEEGDRIVHLERTLPAAGIERMGVTVHDFVDWRARQSMFEGLAAFVRQPVRLGDLHGRDGRATRHDAALVTAEAFALLRTRPLLGRTFRPEEVRPGVATTVILGHRVWQERFGGDPDVLGRAVRVDGTPARVIGVMPEGFRFPVDEDLWLPLRLDAGALPRGRGPDLDVFGRLAPGADLDHARAEMTTIARRLAEEYPETNRGVGAEVKPYPVEWIGGEEVVLLLYTMLVAVFGVLLIACANVANLLLARAALRSHEVALRAALGAGRLRVVAGVLAESLLLAAAGAVLGLALAAVAVEEFDRVVQTTGQPYWMSFGVDGRAALFVVGLTALAGLLSGLFPALRATGAGMGAVLRDESRSSSSFRLGRVARGLVVVEIALACGLLVATGLMIKSVVELRTHDRGLPVDRVLTARIDLDDRSATSTTDRTGARLLAEMERTLRERPEVRAAGITSSLPLIAAGRDRFVLAGATDGGGERPRARRLTVSPGFFDALTVRPVEGRLFTADDRRETRPVALVDQRFAARYFPGESPLGRRIRLGAPTAAASPTAERPWRTIVGVVPDLGLGGIREESPEGIYIPLAQASRPGGPGVDGAILVVRTEGEPLLAGPAMGAAVSSVAPGLPLYRVQTLSDAVHRAYWFVDVFGAIFAIFGGSAMALAVIGLYGVMAFSVQRRSREMGIRMALGADGGAILRLVARQGAAQLGAGLALGFALALVLARGIRVLLYAVEPWDPWILSTVCALLFVTGLTAALVPARQAASVDPAVVLRRD